MCVLQVKGIRGEWIAGQSAGGSRNDFEKFVTNPQFLLQVEEMGKEEEEEEEEEKEEKEG